jgi:hypothetical protein
MALRARRWFVVMLALVVLAGCSLEGEAICRVVGRSFGSVLMMSCVSVVAM